MKKFVVSFVLLVVVVVGVLGAALHKLQQWGIEPMNLSEESRFDVTRGTTLYSLAKELQIKGWIEDARWLRWYARITNQGHLIQAGEYLVVPGTSPQSLITKIQVGEVLQHTVTLVNGHTFDQFKQVLYANPELKKISWNEEEEKTIVQMRAALGNRWAKIARALPGRSP